MLRMSTKALMNNLRSYCDENGHRVTPPRSAVLEILGNAKKPMSAYDVLDALGKKLDNPKPPTAYRALDFLSEHGFAHRIESLNAYVTCSEGHKHQGSQFMICTSCGKVEEAHLCHVPKGLDDIMAKEGFTLSHWNAELHGVCQDCS